TCLNYGCDPTKTLLETARLLYHARHANRYSLRIPTAGFEWTAVLERVHQVIDRMRGGTPEDVRADMARKGIDVVMGEAKFVSPHEVLVSDRSISAPRIIIATGCETVVPPIEGLKEAGFITNVQAVSLPSLPRQ